MSACIFCKIIKKEIPAKVVYEDDLVLAFWDINPQAPVHLLIIPKKHIPAAMDIKDEDSGILLRLYQFVQKTARDQGLEASGFRLVINNGRDAGQAVDHLHIHLLGGRKLQWPPG